AQDLPEALGRMRLAEQGGVAAARRYRQALEARVPGSQAATALSRLRGETARGPVAAVDRPLVRFAQSGLLAIGLAPGLAVDGRDTPATRGALADFARREGIQAGPYDPVVIDRLRARLPRT
ncbi:hypothetical protein, partial [Falsiroseomonas oryziterrae]|uniref:hypothetical protein n=1 Tax=Falsiroseomonas oryziterrae TaxID=2911368 RepID=UPI001F196D80